jgi:hypothetical protein
VAGSLCILSKEAMTASVTRGRDESKRQYVNTLTPLASMKTYSKTFFSFFISRNNKMAGFDLAIRELQSSQA